MHWRARPPPIVWYISRSDLRLCHQYQRYMCGHRQIFKIMKIFHLHIISVLRCVFMIETVDNAAIGTDNISAVLDDLLVDYDKKLRPGFGGDPLEVQIDILLRSMGPISERDMVYTMDIYFRQRWMDERLATNTSIENISVSIKLLEKIWYPDTVFFNGRKSSLHLIPTPNRFIRIGNNGSMYLSQRLTVRAICQMKLQNYPLDFQICPLHIGSFAYSTKDVIYVWRYGAAASVELAADMTLSQFDLTNHSASYSTTFRKGMELSMLSVHFGLKRHSGYFLIHVVVPCILLVILSWVSFWINREATADRIALGTTTVLTMTFLALENRNDLPRVSYATALDVYVAMCFLFVLSTIVQFAVVHHFTKRGHGDLDHSGQKQEPNKVFQRKPAIGRVRFRRQNGTSTTSSRIFVSRAGDSRFGVWLSSLRFRRQARKSTPEPNSVSKVDKISRLMFPVVFIILNLAYWVVFLP
ncbi:Gamma-aminobutyric acid receptor subunit alpha-6 [Mizuhopecten yessoensis]|uniref:Gamma-aminobutyric acid receptor subunit alpha-6 n=1 Tax=Mizuhopecten yessoensis TaxID=6573 RepID=A0A210PXX3_MIZYE|nr:Gamma-aminobutyric acid receptor subunit alpha-6 [Mizuhopecten yessoensis]